jgi:hypothetical protein
MAAVGIEPRDIALYHRVSLDTLRKHYKEELFQGPLEANAQVGKTLLEMSCNGKTPVASIYWTKARGGWSENRNRDDLPVAIPDFVVATEKKAT